MADTPAASQNSDSKTAEIIQQVRPLLRPGREAEAERYIATMVAKSHRGPLPAPEDLAEYNATLPGSAERILAMAEKNLEHRHARETEWQQGEIRHASRGQWLAMIALLSMLAVIAFALFLDQPWIAGILGGATLVSIVSMFLAAQQHKRASSTATPTKKNQPGRRRR